MSSFHRVKPTNEAELSKGRNTETEGETEKGEAEQRQ